MAADESSANPEALFDYHRLATEIKAGLLHDADVLEQTLIDFCASCTEYDTGVTPAAADLLRDQAYETGALGAWVAAVGRAFRDADDGALDALAGGPGSAESKAAIRTLRMDVPGTPLARPPAADRGSDAIEELRLERANVQAPEADRSYDKLEALRTQRGTPPPPTAPGSDTTATAAQSPSIAPPAPPVSERNPLQKLLGALMRSAKFFGPEMWARVQEFFSLESLTLLAGGLVLWVLVNGTPLGWALDLLLLAGAGLKFGWDAWRGGTELGTFLQAALGAQSEADLEAAGVTILGPDLLLAWFAKLPVPKGPAVAPMAETVAVTNECVPEGVPTNFGALHTHAVLDDAKKVQPEIMPWQDGAYA
jgi:hypothetical protein